MKIALSILIFISSFIGFCQPYVGTGSQLSKPKVTIEKAAVCAPPTTTTYMELNNVRAMIHTAGNLWQVPNQNYSQYEIPKNSGIMCLFTAALWLGGSDVNGQLKLAALRYREGQDYWTGPLSKTSAATDNANCVKYDQHYITTKDAVSEFNSWYELGVADQLNGTSLQASLFPDFKIPEVVKNWPAHGDINLGQDYYLAPFFDRNEDGVYKWEEGDYPWYDINKSKECKVDRRVSLYGDMNYWWVMNDNGNVHTETLGQPIGMEIRAQAFCFASNDDVNNMTFYNYELINRGTQTLHNTYFGFFTDGALGNPSDDYVGCDVNRGLAYYYNGNNYDADNSGYKGYGNSPPAVGVDFFEGPYQDNDGIDNAFGIGANEALNGIGYGDGIIDNERFGMRRFLYYSNTTNGADPNQTDPINAVDYYNYLQGRWKDGTKFYYGGSGYVSDPDANPLMPCDFMFPGDTDPLGWGTNGVPQEPWTEQTAGNVPNDRRFLQSAGPFILKPGSVNNITVGVCYGRSGGIDPFESVTVLKRADDKAQALFENCFRVLEGPHAPDLKIQELENELILMLSNSPSSNNFNEQYEELDPFIVSTDPNIDRRYVFQGYQLFQLKSDDVGISDLEDPNRARLVAQCDLKDGFKRIINFEFDEHLQASVPKEKVNGENKGIRHSFSVTEDMFALGNTALVNFKTYHYMAVSYATNNYKTYNPLDGSTLDGQQKIYLMSRKAGTGAVNVISAIPHNPAPEKGGTSFFLNYGDAPQISRIDGCGNGGRILDLTAESESFILQNGFMAKPEYARAAGPIHIKVVDPLNVANGYFECSMDAKGYDATNNNGADSASWIINRYDKEGGTLLETKISDRSIASDNEQIIPQWGISVQIHQQKYTIDSKGEYTEPLSAVMQFSDSSKRWLTGISDQDGFFPTNWIRLGTSDEEETNGSPTYVAPACYKDEVGLDPNKLYGRLLDGIVAPHRLVGYQCDYQPLAYYGLAPFASPGSFKTNARIAYLPSVDIVLTSDQSKWTRCPVFELGRDANLNVGNAKPGDLRNSQSVGKNGQADNSGTYGMGWFPGYAIDIESGARLFMAFGENSFLHADQGDDMIWNPTDRFLDANGIPVSGGLQPIYVYSYQQGIINGNSGIYNLPAYSESTNAIYDLMQLVKANDTPSKRSLYGSLTWIINPLLKSGQRLLSTDVRIKLRVNKEYKKFVATGKNQGFPMYSWNLNERGTTTGDRNQLVDALQLINVVPNPYYAYSEYERNRLDTRVKITNLPPSCTISIYTISGKLIRTLKKDSEQTYVDWDLNNSKFIPISGGVYLIHVDVPDIGTRVLKFFAGMRQVDMYNL